MNVDLNMLGSTMLDWVRSHVYSADIVAEDYSGGGQGLMKFAKKLSNPATLRNGVCNGPVLSLRTRARYCSLPFGRPGDQVIAKVNAITRG
jgi:hypothetical protein